MRWLECYDVCCINFASLGRRPQRRPRLAQFCLRFFCIIEKSGKYEATVLAFSQLQGSTIVIISPQVPGQHMWASAGPGPSSSTPKQWKSDGRVKINNSVSTTSPLTKSKKRKIKKAQQYKSARVSVLTGSEPRKRGKGQNEGFSTLLELNPSRQTICN